MIQIGFILALIVVGYFTGKYFEEKHYKNIHAREKKLQHIAVITGQWKNHIDSNDEGLLFASGTVVASDYFKAFVSSLKNIFGGRMTAYESLLDRGRREALLRIKEKAATWGAHKIINVRIETSTINTSSKEKSSMPCVELMAYGTAIRKKDS